MSKLDISQYENIMTILTFTERSLMYFNLVGTNYVFTFPETQYMFNILYMIHET